MSSTGELTRRLAWEDCYNIRDLGGYGTDDGGQTRWRALLRADNLCRLTPAGTSALRDYGVRTIIDVRSASELRLAAHPFAEHTAADGRLTYLHLPLLDETDGVVQEAMRAAERLEDRYSLMYRLMLDRFRGNMAVIVRAVADAPEGGILVHCHAGKDRTGLVVALLLALAGVPHEAIAADYALSSGYLQPLYDEWFSRQGAAQEDRSAWWLASPPEAMLTVLAALDARHDGVQGYLRAAGVAEEEIERIRDRLRA